MEDEYVNQGPELIIGLVAPVGTDLVLVSRTLKEALHSVAYDAGEEPIRLSSLLRDVGQLGLSDLEHHAADARYDSLMEAGTSLREQLQRGDALAMLSVMAIRALRSARTGSPEKSIDRRAYLLRSLKHPDEVRTLRRIYGPAFVLVSAYSPREDRIRYLAGEFAESHHEFQSQDFRADAERIVQRDEAESGRPLGQNVRKVFPEADIFLDASDPDRLRSSVTRVVNLLFGDTFQTPTRDEYGMNVARGAALRSASLQRQVGAAITTVDGDIVAVGTNEVPRPGGGLYWAGDEPDRRDFVSSREINDGMKRRMIADILQRLRAEGWLAKQDGIQDLLTQALEGEKPFLRNARAMDVIEFGRCVHAEMAALMDAARRGVSVKGGVLYSTTFPCHECAKHIVAAGLQRVVYIEPYPKSLVPELYPDSIVVEGTGQSDRRVVFQPFVGIAPRRYEDVFTMTQRKDERGFRVVVDKSRSRPRLGQYDTSEVAKLTREIREVRSFEESLKSWTPAEDRGLA